MPKHRVRSRRKFDPELVWGGAIAIGVTLLLVFFYAFEGGRLGMPHFSGPSVCRAPSVDGSNRPSNFLIAGGLPLRGTHARQKQLLLLGGIG